MTSALQYSLPLLIGSIASSFLGTGDTGVLFLGQGENPVARDQNAALQAVAKMTEGQRTYYQNNGNFRAKVDNIQEDFGVTLPNTFNYAVRTTSEAAYSYVIPAQSPMSNQLKAYVGAAFITPNQNPKITTIICQNTNPGQTRPADPQLVLGNQFNNPGKLTLQCGDFTVQVPASEVNQ
jgi:Type IV pilin-like G and H, putative